MMHKLKLVIISAALALGFVAPLALAPVTNAACTDAKSCAEEGNSKVNTGGPTSLPAVITNVVKVVLFIAGTLSVVMVIYGGIKYTTSAGDSSKITSAKNTIMYAVIGLIVSILAYTIISFVMANVK